MTIIIIDLPPRLEAGRPSAARPAVAHCQPTVGQQARETVIDRKLCQPVGRDTR